MGRERKSERKIHIFYIGKKENHSLVPRAPPSFPLVAVRKSRRGSGIFSHTSDVRIERMVERI